MDVVKTDRSIRVTCPDSIKFNVFLQESWSWWPFKGKKEKKPGDVSEMKLPDDKKPSVRATFTIYINIVTCLLLCK